MPGMPFCNLHTCLAWERDMSLFHENLENQIGKEKLKASLHQIFNKSHVKSNLSAQTKDLIFKFFSMEKSSKPWNKWSILNGQLKFLYHLMEPFLGIMLDQVPRPTHSKLRVTLQNLYKQMTVPIPGMSFNSIEMHTLPALADGFSQQKYKDLWLESFQRYLQKYDADKVESAIKIVLK